MTSEARYMPSFLTFAHSILWCGGIQGDDTAFLPNMNGDQFRRLLNYVNIEEDPDVDIWCIRYGALIALFCDELDRVVECEILGDDMAAGLRSLSTEISWISERVELREAVDAATLDLKTSNIDEIVKITLLDWWRSVTRNWE